MQEPKVVVFGSLNMDLAIESARVPRQGETIAGTNFLINAGGKGANQAAAAAKFEAPTCLIGAVGNDFFGEQLVDSLASYGVACEEVLPVDGSSTGIAIVIKVDGDNRIILSPGANHALGADQLLTSLGRVAKLGDIFLAQQECAPEATEAALKYAHMHGLFTILNAAPSRTVNAAIWEYVDLLCVNETECEAICGIDPQDEPSLQDALRELSILGPQIVLITLGERGSAALEKGSLIRQQVFQTTAIDTTAAGDTYVGVLAAMLLKGSNLASSMEIASEAAAITASRLGAQQSIPVRSEVMQA